MTAIVLIALSTAVTNTVDDIWSIVDAAHAHIVDIRFNFEGESGRLDVRGAPWDKASKVMSFTGVAFYHRDGVVRRELYIPVEGGVDRTFDSLRIGGEWRKITLPANPKWKTEDSGTFRDGLSRFLTSSSFLPYFSPAYIRILPSSEKGQFVSGKPRMFDGRLCEVVENNGADSCQRFYFDMERDAALIGKELERKGQLISRLHDVQLTLLEYGAKGRIWFPVLAVVDNFTDVDALLQHKIVVRKIPTTRFTYRALPETVAFNEGKKAEALEVALDPRFVSKVAVAKPGQGRPEPGDAVRLPTSIGVTKAQFRSALDEAQQQRQEYLSKRQSNRRWEFDLSTGGICLLIAGTICVLLAFFLKRRM